MLVSLEISNKDQAYPWFLEWLAHTQAQRSPDWLRSNRLSLETRVAYNLLEIPDVDFKMVAGPGRHWVQYGGTYIMVRAPVR